MDTPPPPPNTHTPQLTPHPRCHYTAPPGGLSLGGLNHKMTVQRTVSENVLSVDITSKTLWTIFHQEMGPLVGGGGLMSHVDIVMSHVPII